MLHTLSKSIVSAPIKVIIACGGTGGHLFPGIAVAQELKSRGHDVLLLISEKKVDAEASKKYTDLRFETVKAIAKPPTFSPRMISFLWRLWRTIARCGKIIKREKADVILGMGGFTSLPPVHAGAKQGLRTYVHDSNAIPGRSNLLTAKQCTKVLVGLEEAVSHFGEAEVVVTGTPVRDELENLPGREAACRVFGLDPAKKTLLVMGGSQGAQKLNEVVAAGTAGSDWQVIHLAGRDDYDRVVMQVGSRKGYKVLAFCDQMAAAYAASDFCVARSGASSLTELSRAGLPALLVPYPYAADDHQTANAEVYENARAAVLKQQDELDEATIKGMLASLNDEIIEAMSAAMSSLAVPDAAAQIANVLEG
ncbi:undecaprenyldiphospho-muramoylpentapeptide beta-N-acetylglucosaminyltransferase [Verrucomicrobiaceae bacterium 227]